MLPVINTYNYMLLIGIISLSQDLNVKFRKAFALKLDRKGNGIVYREVLFSAFLLQRRYISKLGPKILSNEVLSAR